MEWPDNRFEYLPHIRAQMAKGWGCHREAKYRGWRNFRSRARLGTERVFKCSKTGREVNHKSCAHKVYALLQERRDCVVSIEEDWPLLNILQTLEVCAQLGLQHPERNKLVEPLVVSFLIREIRDGKDVAVARSLASESPEPGAPVSHLDAIQLGCERLGLEWKVVHTGQLDETMLNSLMFARAWLSRRVKIDHSEAERFAKCFLKHHRRPSTLKECWRRLTFDPLPRLMPTEN
jgi:hypothetical protein